MYIFTTLEFTPYFNLHLYMIVAGQNSIRNLEYPFHIGDQKPLKGEMTYKYFGVEIDQSLTWKDQIDKIAKKVSRGIGVLRRVRHLVPYEILITMYNSLVLHIMIIVVQYGETVGKECLTHSRNFKIEPPEWSHFLITINDRLSCWMSWDGIILKNEDKIQTCSYQC